MAIFLGENGAPLSEKNLVFKATEILTSQGERPLSFDPILALNENAAKPHALPTDKQLQNGDLLLMDAGIKHARYCSDRTRTAYFHDGLNFSRQQHFKDPVIQKAYDLVLKAHDEAIRRAKPGMKAHELDAIAREIITAGGYGERFIHSLGHGVGLDIHEHPYINKRNDEVLKPNMVFTIEPGIYIPGVFGIRIEDTVVLKEDGAHIL
jgi:Xaa-Pro aminopeptidase